MRVILECIAVLPSISQQLTKRGTEIERTVLGCVSFHTFQKLKYITKLCMFCQGYKPIVGCQDIPCNVTVLSRFRSQRQTSWDFDGHSKLIPDTLETANSVHFQDQNPKTTFTD